MLLSTQNFLFGFLYSWKQRPISQPETTKVAIVERQPYAYTVSGGSNVYSFFPIIHTPKSLSYSVFYVLHGNVKSSQRKPGKVLKTSREEGQQNKQIGLVEYVMDKYTKHRFFTALVLEIRASLYSNPFAHHFYKQIFTIF